MTRNVIVVDCETSALRPNMRRNMLSDEAIGVWGVATEVAWHDLATGEHGCFVPKHRVHMVRAYGDRQALVVSRYLERLAGVGQDDGTQTDALHERLTGATLAGSNPAFDARFLAALFADQDDPEPWHHRLLDLSAFAAGRLGLPIDDLPGLAAMCERLGVEPPDHTAEGDVLATVGCFHQLLATETTASEATA